MRKLIKRRALKKLLKNYGLRWGGIYKHYLMSNKRKEKVASPKIIVVFSKSAEYHILQQKDKYIVRDVGMDGAECKNITELLKFIDKCDRRWKEWMEYQEKMYQEWVEYQEKMYKEQHPNGEIVAMGIDFAEGDDWQC